MSTRGELLSFGDPCSDTGAALAGEYTVAAADSAQAAAAHAAPHAAATVLEVRDELQKLVCRILTTPEPSGGHWLTLQPLRGYEHDGERIRERLTHGGLLTEDQWLSIVVPMEPDERSDLVTARVLLRLLEIQDANLPGTLADLDIEYLHDFRVSIRRARSVMREMRGVFSPIDLAKVRAEYKWLQDQTSDTRDLDVYLHEFDELRDRAPESMRANLDPLRALLSARHSRARAHMQAALRSPRAQALRTEWEEILRVLVLEDEAERPDAARPIVALTGERVRRVHKQMVAMGRAIEPGSPPTQYHELRKKGKELRYLLELFAAQLCEPELVRSLVRALKGLQDVLGVHQDRDIQMHTLHAIGDSLLTEPGGAGALMAIGVLVHRLERDAEQARGQFAASFAGFASDAQCKLVADTFRR